jgi:hypothetical protein
MPEPGATPTPNGSEPKVLLPVSMYRYSVLAVQLRVSFVSMPTPAVQPARVVVDAVAGMEMESPPNVSVISTKAGEIQQRGAGHITEAAAQSAVPSGLGAGDDDVIVFLECVVDAERSDIAFDADQPPRSELPVVARGQAQRHTHTIDVDPSHSSPGRIARHRGDKPAFANAAAVIGAHVEAVPVIDDDWRGFVDRLDRHVGRHGGNGDCCYGRYGPE